MIETPLFWTCRALARLERAGGVRSPRLTEPGHEKWLRLRRQLGWADFLEVLHEDLAAAFPVPCDVSRWRANPFAALTEEQAERLVAAAGEPDPSDTSSFLRQAARSLGLPAGGNIAELPKAQPSQKVLELPGAAGRIAAQQAQTHGLAFDQVFTFVADSDAELVLIGLAALELRANPPTVLSSAELAERLRRGPAFDRVFGVTGWEPATRLVATHQLDARWA